MGRCARQRGGGVISPTETVAHDPSVADYRATSPSEWGGISLLRARSTAAVAARSFGQGRKPCSTRCCPSSWSRSSEPQKLDLAALFGAREVWLEVGFGAGEHLVWQAEQHPDVGLIGCEPYINGVAKCLAHIERTGRAQRAPVHRRRAAGDGGAARAVAGPRLRAVPRSVAQDAPSQAPLRGSATLSTCWRA